ncbi:MAG: hypothetical protein U1F29_10700 [Planctomycetota bacterium]
MDYRIRRSKAELDSTGFIELGPGRYSGAHWQPGFVFVWSDAFGMAEGILARHVDGYDHLDTNDVHRDVMLRVTAEWRSVALRLPTLSTAEAAAALHLERSFAEPVDAELDAHRAEITRMLLELSEACEGFCAQSDWVCVLGV